MSNDVENRINKKSAEIEKRLLDGGVDSDGKLDMVKLKSSDESLFEALQEFAMSKTWRDDPKISARDVAKLLEARSGTTPLGAALEKLGHSLTDD